MALENGITLDERIAMTEKYLQDLLIQRDERDRHGELVVDNKSPLVNALDTSDRSD